jgi:hypothetical protein
MAGQTELATLMLPEEGDLPLGARRVRYLDSAGEPDHEAERPQAHHVGRHGACKAVLKQE